MTKQTDQEYEALHKLSKNIYMLGGIVSLLHWDQETHMPEGATEIRAQQLQTLAGIRHKEKTSRKFSNALSKLIDLESGKIHASRLPSNKKAALTCWRLDYLKATALPETFVREFTRVTSEGQMVWKHARSNDKFADFAPYLEKIIGMNRKMADYLGYREHPYDALLDNYEPGMTTAEVSKLFNSLRQSVSNLLKEIMQAKQIDDSFLFGTFPQKKQLEFAKSLLNDMGYTEKYGRLDFSAHPFSSSCHPTDSRITTRIHTSGLMENIFAVLHEGGHSLYEMGLPQEHYGTPLCEAISLGMHESQSRWWETRIGKNKAFWKHYLPLLKQTFKGKLDEISLNDFYRSINKVAPTLIRVESDEVTYPLHVIVRFELECALIEGELKVKDLPEAWNEKMGELLHIRPPSNKDGCLQDIHWAMGAFGYFPTYTLGNMFAAQLFERFELDHPDWEMQVSQGELSFIREWLGDKVHCFGRQYDSKELLKKSTGKKFSSEAYASYLDNKYREIYSL